jgi:cytochrome c-type biogenesis protein
LEPTVSIGLLIAFSAGLLSFLSPCVLPLIPSYVTFITGMSLEEAQRARRTTLAHALLFITGFTIIFMAMGATATAVGGVLAYYREWVARIGGVLIIIFGLYLLGALPMRLLSEERRVYLANKPAGYLGSVVVGLAFGAGWTPCIGPILGSILIYSGSSADMSRGLMLLFTYSMGLAVPFLVAALLIGRFMGWFHRFRPAMVWMSRIGGALLILIGLLLVTNYFTILATYLQALTPEFIRGRI